MALLNIDRKYKIYSINSLYIGIVIFLVGSTIAILTHPNYSMTDNWFSDTGLRVEYNSGERGIIDPHPYPEIFNVTLYLTAIFIFPFLAIVNTMIDTKGKERFLFYSASIAGVFVSPSLISVGIWDYGTDDGAHELAARLTMGCIGLFFILWTAGVISLNPDSPYKQINSWKLDPFVTVLIVFFAFTQVWGVPNIPLIEDVAPQIYQKLVPYTTIPYLSFVAYRLNKILSDESKE